MKLLNILYFQLKQAYCHMLQITKAFISHNLISMQFNINLNILSRFVGSVLKQYLKY